MSPQKIQNTTHLINKVINAEKSVSVYKNILYEHLYGIPLVCSCQFEVKLALAGFTMPYYSFMYSKKQPHTLDCRSTFYSSYFYMQLTQVEIWGNTDFIAQWKCLSYDFEFVLILPTHLYRHTRTQSTIRIRRP